MTIAIYNRAVQRLANKQGSEADQRFVSVWNSHKAFGRYIKREASNIALQENLPDRYTSASHRASLIAIREAMV